MGRHGKASPARSAIVASFALGVGVALLALLPAPVEGQSEATAPAPAPTPSQTASEPVAAVSGPRVRVTSREITLKNYCIERQATLENAGYLQGRIERGDRTWQRTRRNLQTARDGLRRHAEMLEDRIAIEGADHRVVCQANKFVVDASGNALSDAGALSPPSSSSLAGSDVDADVNSDLRL